MALWKDQAPAKPIGAGPTPTSAEPVRLAPEPAANGAPTTTPTPMPAAAPARNARQASESLIAADLTIEGKIHGTGHVRIAGQFKGDVNVDGDLTIERGAKLIGGVRAAKITIAGELEGNVESAQRVELLEGGILTGDLKAGAFTVAAGARMRGQVEFGWDEKSPTVRPGNESNT